ncbi:hypothetical protein CQ048_15875 [Pseudomonas trivialis]|nr:hypothetical protein CQ048_15875 [Pseudomonas trivialis]PRB25485.1 hypothetical protein CQ041_15615 [Pseudomonas sp. MYb60]
MGHFRVAPGSVIPGLLTRAQSPRYTFSSDVWRRHQSRSFSHEKITPNPPSTPLFTIAPDISPETLLVERVLTLTQTTR